MTKPNVEIEFLLTRYIVDLERLQAPAVVVDAGRLESSAFQVTLDANRVAVRDARSDDNPRCAGV